MAFIIHSLALGAIPYDGYLVSYDVNARGGRGEAVFSRYQTEALRFPTQAAAWDAWQEQSTVTPRRPDGEPNRPLSAYTVMFEPVQ